MRKIGFGICMDLNPYRFQSAFDAFEFAHFHKEAKTQLLLCSMNWLYQPEDHDMTDTDPYGGYQNQPAMSTIQYWVLRSLPLIEASHEYPILMVIANRIGKEKGTPVNITE
jgi:protein N-terminal amidase